MTSTTTSVALLAALTAVTLGGTALARPPAAADVTPGFGGGRGAFAAAGPALLADGHRRHDDGRDDDGHDDDGDDEDVRTAHVRTRAKAVVHRDDRDRRAAAWRERRVTAQVLVARNRATALTHDCTGCTAVAVSVQVVVDSGSDGRVTARNRAVAATVRCTRCSATALAYQFVVAGPGRLTLTRDARHRLRDLRQEMRDVARHAPAADVTAREDALAARVADVLRAGVVVEAAGRSAAPSASPSASVQRAAAPNRGVEVTVRRARDHA